MYWKIMDNTKMYFCPQWRSIAKVFSKVERAGSKRKIANMKDVSTTFQIYKGEVSTIL